MLFDWGYFEKPITQSLPFCSDGLFLQRKYADCRPWDQFSNPIEFGAQKWEEGLESFPFNLSLKFSFLGSPKTQNKEQRIRSVFLQPKREAFWSLWSRRGSCSHWSWQTKKELEAWRLHPLHNFRALLDVFRGHGSCKNQMLSFWCLWPKGWSHQSWL